MALRRECQVMLVKRQPNGVNVFRQTAYLGPLPYGPRPVASGQPQVLGMLNAKVCIHLMCNPTCLQGLIHHEISLITFACSRTRSPTETLGATWKI